MPRGDGRGPAGLGRGAGYGRQIGTGTAIGKGRMGGPLSAGPEGYCECPKCGTKVKHNRVEPCSSTKCPQCGTAMVRE